MVSKPKHASVLRLFVAEFMCRPLSKTCHAVVCGFLLENIKKEIENSIPLSYVDIRRYMLLQLMTASDTDATPCMYSF
jgi:hypothetical protein